ncbi:NAD(P)/FAD-dependent oxidoreductase [Agriterribacter sp.]|uniref:phytoene desaturase family protein n=1 Tax=Agriterribacter sp. TaxID=2821509 RepID=UPI002B63B853|nr:NAD(P)/FAD-dependent oxidoreductase [Agriterribacter sp.]HRO47624.1 NAD(P)/FAD-dependent oxidoreductase [Agriterribacter sp.]HRQ17172.1 NAD(P)/FAD-dependent oxidoreductase [Agriterribacter sp.]
MNRFDIVIIGSGIGGLVCGGILSREGYRVCVLEKNKQIGGSLQTFSREKEIFDSGVHYIGGLDKGQNLYQIFKYLGVMDKLKLQRMDEDAFDKIIISNDQKAYRQAQGYENFIKRLADDFPGEETAIRNYCDKIKETCDKFPLYNLRTNGLYEEKADVLTLDTHSVITSLTRNTKLQAVLVGNNALYVGRPDETPFYIHALIINSYIESSWKCINGGSQIGKILAGNIRGNGGEIIRNCEVIKIVTEAGKAVYAEAANGARYYADQFISNIHPAKTMEITNAEVIKNIYRKRIRNLPHTISSFLIHIVLKKGSFKYFRHNYYYHKAGEIWNLADYTEDNWPLGYALFFPPSAKTGTYADAMTIFTYMRYDEVAPWQHTFNTVSAENDRGTTYNAFKKYKAEILLDCVEEKFPGLRNCIQSYTTSTPLSYRDYIGNYDGSLYGIAKDYKDPLKTFISPRTKVRNLFLTGQNINIHGVLGSSISALLTCVSLLGNENVVEKIRNA